MKAMEMSGLEASRRGTIPGRDRATSGVEDRFGGHLERLASYALAASRRRGLTVGELAEDIADALIAISGAHDGPRWGRGPARPFLETLVQALGATTHRVRIDCDPALELPADELATIGMIASEAISNALKYAFPEGRAGQIWLRLVVEEGRIKLTIRDNGIGMPDLPPDPHSGRGLIDALARQFGGYARLGSAPFGGALVSVIYRRR